MTADETSLEPAGEPVTEPAAAAAPGPEPAPSAAPATGRGHHRQPVAATWRRVPPLTAALLVLCLVAAGFAAFFAVDRGGGTAAAPDTSLLTPTTRAATLAARHAVVQVLSYNYKTIATDVRHAEADSTGLFLRQYRATASRLLAQARQQRAIVQASIGSSGVVSAGPGNVVVLLFVDQYTVRQPKGPSSNSTRVDQSRVRVTMTRTGGSWRISQLAAL